MARITLNRPERLNSFNRAMHVDMRAALDRVEKDPAIRALVIAGAGRGFCAGQDLSEMPDDAAEVGNLLHEAFNPLIRRMRALPKPIIASVHGMAAGGGANVALACDLVLASRSAYFLQAFVNIGLMPDCGGTYFLPQRIGMARAIGLAMLGEKLPAEKAEQWGLILRCVEDAQLDAEVNALAHRLAGMPTVALAAIKQAMQAAPNNSIDQQLDLERDLQAKLGATHDFSEGVRAFLDKRPARFEGR